MSPATAACRCRPALCRGGEPADALGRFLAEHVRKIMADAKPGPATDAGKTPQGD